MIEKVTDPTQGVLMQEIISKRTENSKTFDLGGGKRRLESHIGAIHYKDNYADSTEAWKDIDLTIRDGKITKAPYELMVSGNKLTLKDKKTGEVSTIELLSVSPAGIPFKNIPEFSAVRFQHILPTDKVPFEAKFRITGKPPITRAFDDEGELELETSFRDSILTEKLSSIIDKNAKQVRLAKGNIRIDPTWQVGASSDDCHRVLSIDAWNLAQNSIVAGKVWADNRWGGGMRFTNVTIPQGSTIDASSLTLRCSWGTDSTPVYTRISAEKEDNPATFADNKAAFDTRWANRTIARVNWDNIAAWTADIDYDSPEIKTVIQEIIDRANWASGNAIVIFWEDFEARTTGVQKHYRQARSYDGSTTYCPKLVVTYAGNKKATPPTLALALTKYVPVVTATAKPKPPTNVAATSGDHTDKVVITWTKATGATKYEVFRDDAGLGELGDVATYDDSDADASVIAPGAAVASDGEFLAHVALSLSGHSVADGTTHTYMVKAGNADGWSAASSSNTGYRGHGELTYQWQRTLSDALP